MMEVDMERNMRLYVIGNGFDKHHDMRCGYGDFKKWLEENHKNVYDNLTRIYGNCDSDWWRTFEESLAKIDPDKYPDEVAGKSFFELKRLLEERYGALGREAIDAYEEAGGDINNKFRLSSAIAHFEMEKLKEDLNDAFGEWVMTLGVPSREHYIDWIDKNATFFTFNYTRTLEDLYGVGNDQIVHLHGSVDNGIFVIGHNLTLEDILNNDMENAYDRDPDADVGEDEARMELFEVIADQLRKPVMEIIDEHKVAFNELSTLLELIVLGFSYSPVDLPYLRRIFEIAGTNIKVKFGWHTLEDEKNAEAFRDEMALSNCELMEF